MFIDVLSPLSTYIFTQKFTLTRIRQICIGLAPWIRIWIRTEIKKNWIHNTGPKAMDTWEHGGEGGVGPGTRHHTGSLVHQIGHLNKQPIRRLEKSLASSVSG
jgi:hypothetical protein